MYQNGVHLPLAREAMLSVGPVSAARLASLATGRGGVPEVHEWPIVVALLALIAFLGTRLLVAVGLTRLEALLVAGLAPLLVLIDAPLGTVSSSVQLAANVAGCIIPAGVAIKVLAEGRVPFAESVLLLGAGIVVSYFSSHVVAERGVLLQYRIPAVVVGVLAAGVLYTRPEKAGAGAFAAGALGVVFGADVMHLGDLASGAGVGRVILGGAGLLDGIVLVALLAAGIGSSVSVLVRSLLRLRIPAKAAG